MRVALEVLHSRFVDGGPSRRRALGGDARAALASRARRGDGGAPPGRACRPVTMRQLSWWLEWPAGSSEIGVVFLVAVAAIAVVVRYPLWSAIRTRSLEQQRPVVCRSRRCRRKRARRRPSGRVRSARAHPARTRATTSRLPPTTRAAATSRFRSSRRYYRYFLMPRRQAEDAPWVICYGCDLGGIRRRAEVVWEGAEGISIVRIAAVTVHALAGLVALNFLFLVSGAALLWLVRAWRLDRRRSPRGTRVPRGRRDGRLALDAAAHRRSSVLALARAGLPVGSRSPRRRRARRGRSSPRERSLERGRSSSSTAVGIAARGSARSRHFRPSVSPASTSGTPGRSGSRRRRRSTSSASSTRSSSPRSPARRIRRSSRCSTPPRSTSWAAPMSSRSTCSTGSSGWDSSGRSPASWRSACRRGSSGRSCCFSSSRRASAGDSRSPRRTCFSTTSSCSPPCSSSLWILDRRALEARVRDRVDLRDGAHETRGPAPRACSSSQLALASARDWRSRGRALGARRGRRRAVAAPVADLVRRPRSRGGGRRAVGLDPTENAERALAVSAAGVRRTLLERLLECDRPGRGRRARPRRPRARLRARRSSSGRLSSSSPSVAAGSPGPFPSFRLRQELGGNPIVRFMGAAALLCAAASPLLLAAAWSAVTSGRRPRTIMTRPSLDRAVGDRRSFRSRLPACHARRRRAAVPDPRRSVSGPAVEGQPVDVVFRALRRPASRGGVSRSLLGGRVRRAPRRSPTAVDAGRSFSKTFRVSRSHARSRPRPRRSIPTPTLELGIGG